MPWSAAHKIQVCAREERPHCHIYPGWFIFWIGQDKLIPSLYCGHWTHPLIPPGISLAEQRSYVVLIDIQDALIVGIETLESDHKKTILCS